jgi:hypothetical protein
MLWVLYVTMYQQTLLSALYYNYCEKDRNLICHANMV